MRNEQEIREALRLLEEERRQVWLRWNVTAYDTLAERIYRSTLNSYDLQVNALKWVLKASE